MDNQDTLKWLDMMDERWRKQRYQDELTIFAADPRNRRFDELRERMAEIFSESEEELELWQAYEMAAEEADLAEGERMFFGGMDWGRVKEAHKQALLINEAFDLRKEKRYKRESTGVAKIFLGLIAGFILGALLTA